MIFTIGYQGTGYGNSSHFVRAIAFLGKRKAKSCENLALSGLHRIRTSDLYDVNVAL